VTPAARLKTSTLLEALQHRLDHDPDGTAAVFVWPDRDDERWTFRRMLGLAWGFAERITHATTDDEQADEPRLTAICLGHSPELHAAFLGALLAGRVPTMVAPPSPRMERRKYTDAFARMLDHVRPSEVITSSSVLASLEELTPEALAGHRLLAAETISPSPARGIPVVSADDVALVQHSSGTTGLQKGVAITHRALFAQLRSYADTLSLTNEDVIVSWLPLYHDMGFVACFLLPLVTGVPVVELSPFDWVARPQTLLTAIERHRGTLAWLPNFAFSFLGSVRTSDGEGAPDLSSVRAFVNCSEPVMAASHRAFAKRWPDVRPSQLTTCYAMAENVFAVTQSPVGEAPRVAQLSRRALEVERRAAAVVGDEPAVELTSNGRPIAGVSVAILDADGASLPEGRVGEIGVKGTSLFEGYFHRPDLTAAAFVDGWYRTGDLGFIVDGELYVTGRKKDLVILAGRNFHPGDIEAEVSTIEGVLPGRVAAFGDSDEASGTELLVIVAESELEDRAVKAKLELEIRKRVAQTFDCTVARTAIVPPRWLVKSTSGKVARADTRAKYRELVKP